MASGDKDICVRVLFAANKAKSISLLLICLLFLSLQEQLHAMFPSVL